MAIHSLSTRIAQMPCATLARIGAQNNARHAASLKARQNRLRTTLFVHRRALPSPYTQTRRQHRPKRKRHTALYIGIAGGSGSGKSTFINKIEGRFDDKIAILHYDNYYREQAGVAFKQRAAMNYDHPDSLETDLLAKHLEELKRGHAIQSPVYDFSQHNRLDKTVEAQPYGDSRRRHSPLADKRLRPLCDDLYRGRCR
ncbi:MAG: hypothetical protein ACLS9I_06450 [Adlercreutzia equolifaciens]